MSPTVGAGVPASLSPVKQIRPSCSTTWRSTTGRSTTGPPTRSRSTIARSTTCAPRPCTPRPRRPVALAPRPSAPRPCQPLVSAPAPCAPGPCAPRPCAPGPGQPLLVGPGPCAPAACAPRPGQPLVQRPGPSAPGPSLEVLLREVESKPSARRRTRSELPTAGSANSASSMQPSPRRGRRPSTPQRIAPTPRRRPRRVPNRCDRRWVRTASVVRVPSVQRNGGAESQGALARSLGSLRE